MTRFKLKSANKYGAKRTIVDGIIFDSCAEADYYRQLKMMKLAGIVKDFILQPRFELLAPYVKNGRKVRGIDYVADFKVLYADGHEEIVDVKGKKTEVYVLKRKWFESKYPDLTITEVLV